MARHAYPLAMFLLLLTGCDSYSKEKAIEAFYPPSPLKVVDQHDQTKVVLDGPRLFLPATCQVNPDAKRSLAKAAELVMSMDTGLKVDVAVSHQHASSTAAYDLALAQAEVVAAYLWQSGIASERIHYHADRATVGPLSPHDSMQDFRIEISLS